MNSSATTSEITESKDDLATAQCSKDLILASVNPNSNHSARKKHDHPLEDQINRLIETFDLSYSSKALCSSHLTGVNALRKSALKKPIRGGPSNASGIGISESVTLKQALRRLCISQASEMAAMKRLSKPTGSSNTFEAGTIKKLYTSVVVQASESVDDENGSILEITLVPEKSTTMTSNKTNESSKNPTAGSFSKTDMQSAHSQISSEIAAKIVNPKVRDVLASTRSENVKKSSGRDEKRRKEKIKSQASVFKSNAGKESSKRSVSPCSAKATPKTKISQNKKGKNDSSSKTESSSKGNDFKKVASLSCKNKPFGRKETTSSAPNCAQLNPEVAKDKEEVILNKPDSTPINCNGGGAIRMKRRENSRSGEKGEFSQSSKSSIGDYSSSTSLSDESNQSGSSGIGVRPHMSNDVRWAAIRHVEMQNGSIGLRNFKLLKRLGCGDIGSVYLAELIGSECMFALKVMDNEFLINRKKIMRAQTEREILQILDHPFLPTLYTHFTTDNLSCLVMEYCPGGDLHVLRQRQIGRCFTEPAARFYVAEVLLALEYLHMLGVVYRDLKPENILVREDGHIMLSDFDLSLRCTVKPTLLKSSSLGAAESASRISGVCAESSCIYPSCLQPSWVQVSCFTPRLLPSTAAKTRKLTTESTSQVRPLPQLVVEPIEARSNSFVGTHEYLAPEIIKGEGHGSSVDWWTFGIFLYELLYGRTPFKGPGNEETLANVVSQSLKFPDNPAVSFRARDLIRGLLVKEPENRLGSLRGAAEIKQHPFFEGLNWALIRCATPPETPKPCEFGVPAVVPPKKKAGKCLEFKGNGVVEFELF